MPKIKTTIIGFGVMLAGASISLPTYAQEPTAQCPVQSETSQVERQFSKEAGILVSEANEMMTAEDYRSAVLKLKSALDIKTLNTYERSIISQMLGAAYFQSGNLREAKRSFERAISACGLLPKEVLQLQNNIDQLAQATH